jgi:hypothetical protein
MKDVIIILTTTVNVFDVDKMYQKSKKDRIDTYNRSLSEWLKTDFKIIVVDNSGYKYPEFKENARFKKISYTYDSIRIPFGSYFIKNTKNKGDHEMLSIMYAYKNIPIFWKYNKIFKLTGRYYIPDFNKFIKKIPNTFKFYIQNNSNRCELFGTDKLYFLKLFILPKRNEQHINLENKKKKIIEMLHEQNYNIYKFPKIPVNNVIKGSSNRIIYSL